MNQLTKIFEGHELRIVERDGEPWFVAKDVCDILEINNNRQALARLDEDEKGVSLIDTLGGKQKLATVNEFGLYSLVLSSRKAEAKKFKRWITHEVIPSIRKTGSYSLEKNESLSVERLSPELQMFKQLWDGMARKELEDAKRDEQIKGLETTVTVIKDTFLHKDDNWRKSINRMLNQAVSNSNYGYQEIRRKSYQQLEERARCKLSVRLLNLKDRLEESGATATRIKEATKLEVIESDARLKEIYTTIVKELSIGSLV